MQPVMEWVIWTKRQDSHAWCGGVGDLGQVTGLSACRGVGDLFLYINDSFDTITKLAYIYTYIYLQFKLYTLVIIQMFQLGDLYVAKELASHRPHETLCHNNW